MPSIETIFSQSEEVLVTMAILGSAMQGDADHMVAILTGDMDDRMRRMIFFRDTKRHAVTEKDLQHPLVTQSLERVKNFFRFRIEESIAQEERQRERAHRDQEKREFDKLTAQMRQSNKPHPMGTVDQLAKQFGVSKSEIRRRKADNTLGELVLNASEKI